VSPVVIFRDEETKKSAIKRIQIIKPDQDKPLAMWIGPYKKIRTLAQNDRYWWRVGLIVKASGHSKIALHQMFKEMAFGKVIEEINGKLVEYTPSSSKVERGDFSELIEHVEAFIAKHGIEESA
jgi:hypothetical protein